MTLPVSRDAVDAARRRAERIRIKARTISDQYESLRALVDEAERNEDHLALGYPSWPAYLADVFGDEPLRLPRDERIPMSRMLSEKGMSTRAIGAVLGVDHKTVISDRSGGEFSPPAPQSPTAEPVERPTQSEVDDAEHGTRNPAASRPVVGLDGKTYTRPAPSAPKRRPLADQAHDAAANLTAALERVERIFADDRFTQNREQVGEVTRAHLLRTAQVCQHLAEQLPS